MCDCLLHSGYRTNICACSDYRNAYAIYDSLSYHRTHNFNTLNDLNNDTNAGVFDKVRDLANNDAYHRYANTSTDTSPSPATRSMAGRTLASLLTKRLSKIVNNSGNATNALSQPLSLLFGEFDTMLSLLSVLDADYYQPAPGSIRASIPDFASALIFELFTTGNASAEDVENLWVRFSFHNGTDAYDDAAPQSYSIFRNGPSRDAMSWSEFEETMARVGISQADEWCEACSSSSIFCANTDIDLTPPLPASETAPHGISPVVAGVIGAAVTLAFAALLAGLACLLGGVRLHRVERRASSLGGFKGSAKLASDPDLSLANKGVVPAGAGAVVGSEPGDKRHERVGSWELRAKEGRDSERGSFEAIEAAMVRAVQPRRGL